LRRASFWSKKLGAQASRLVHPQKRVRQEEPTTDTHGWILISMVDLEPPPSQNAACQRQLGWAGVACQTTDVRLNCTCDARHQGDACFALLWRYGGWAGRRAGEKIITRRLFLVPLRFFVVDVSHLPALRCAWGDAGQRPNATFGGMSHRYWGTKVAWLSEPSPAVRCAGRFRGRLS